MTLGELAAREAEIYTSVEQAAGRMEEKYAALAAAGVFDAYAGVLAGYVALFDDPDAGTEALKRAAFLIWYDVAEPGCFTGVFDLPAPLVRQVLTRLDAAVARGQVDEELEAMLGYYREVADFAFTRGGPWPALAQLLATSDPEAWRARVPVPPQRWSRGQMSDYWAAVSRVT